jgi:hypothetical protein
LRPTAARPKHIDMMNVVRRRTRAVPKVPWPNAAPKVHDIQLVLTE